MTKTVAISGDSQTDVFAGLGVDAWQVWGAQLARSARRRGFSYRSRIYGKSGDTTTQMLARVGQLLRFDTPDIGIIYGGVNDPGSSIATATTRLNIRAMLLALKHGAAGDGENPQVHVADQTALPDRGLPGQRYVVLADGSTTGGQAAYEPFHATTITGSNSGAPSVWEYRHPRAGEFGWGRVAVSSTAPTAVKKVMVISTNYLNFTTGGDTLSTPFASYATVRTAQAGAVSDEQVSNTDDPVYVDLYNFQRNRIVAGTDPDFSSVAYDQAQSWHYIQNNQHHSFYGHSLVAQAALAAMPNGWLS